LILDSVGRTTFKQDLDAIAVRGHIVCCGASSGPHDPIEPYALAARSVSLSFGGRWARTPEEMAVRANDVIGAIRDGWLHLHIGASCRSNRLEKRTHCSKAADRRERSC
jgi:NADPH:quinone reductase